MYGGFIFGIVQTISCFCFNQRFLLEEWHGLGRVGRIESNDIGQIAHRGSGPGQVLIHAVFELVEQHIEFSIAERIHQFIQLNFYDGCALGF